MFLNDTGPKADSATTERFSLFPVADQQIFPPRRPRAGKWYLGLNLPEEEEPVEAAPVEEKEESEPSMSLLNDARARGTITALGKFARKLDRGASGIKERASNAAELNAFFVRQYATKELDEPSPEIKQKYFGEDATKKFYETYQVYYNVARIRCNRTG